MSLVAIAAPLPPQGGCLGMRPLTFRFEPGDHLQRGSIVLRQRAGIGRKPQEDLCALGLCCRDMLAVAITAIGDDDIARTQMEGRKLLTSLLVGQADLGHLAAQQIIGSVQTPIIPRSSRLLEATSINEQHPHLLGKWR